MQTVTAMIAGRRSVAGLALRAAAAAACAIMVCGCNTDQQVTGVPEVPVDYRLRHPITLHEANRTLRAVPRFQPRRAQPDTARAGAGVRLGLEARRDRGHGGRASGRQQQRARRRRRDARDRFDPGRERPAAAKHRRAAPIQHRPGRSPAPLRISYPRIRAQAGPCGLWPEDIGPSFNRNYFENQPPWNYGCATQNALAAEIANPADLVQPRAETPAYTMRRATVLQKYTSGQNPSTEESGSTNAAKISDVGK